MTASALSIPQERLTRREYAAPFPSATRRGEDGTPDIKLHHLTILFSDLCDSVGLAELAGPSRLVALLESFRWLCRSTVARHGGQIARLQGDGMLAFFGFPEPSADDGSRAMACAVELHAAVRAMRLPGAQGELPLPALHSGIHGGLTYVAPGDLERGRFDLVGNSPNLAARMCAVAERDEICVTQQAIGPHAGRYTTRAAQALEPKGWARPVMAYRIGCHAGAPEVGEP